MQALPYPDEGFVDDIGLDTVLVETVPGREIRSLRYKGKTGLADRGMMMGLGKRVIADKGR